MTTITTQDLQIQIASIAVSCLTESDWDGERLPIWSVNAAEQIIALLKPAEYDDLGKAIVLIDAIAPVQLPTRSAFWNAVDPPKGSPNNFSGELREHLDGAINDLVRAGLFAEDPDQPESEPESAVESESDDPPYSPGTVRKVLDDLLARVKLLESGKGASDAT